MKDDTILQFTDPAGISPDPLTEILRKGARDLLAQAVEAELCDLLARHAHLRDSAGRARLVRHGHLPEREVMTGIGPVPVKVPRVSGTAATQTGTWARPPASSSRGLPTASSRAQTGAALPSGYMTTCPIRHCISSPRWRHSTSPGTKNFSGGLPAISNPEAS